MTTHQVRFNWTVNGRSSFNVTNWDLPSTSPAAYQNFADAIRNTIDTNLVPYISPNCTLQDLTIRPMSGGAKFSFDQAFTNGPVSGSNLGNLYDQTSPFLVSYRSLAAPPNRGRFNVPGMTEADWDGSNWSASSRGDIEALFRLWALALTITEGDCRLIIGRPDFVLNDIPLWNNIDTVVSRAYTRKLTSRRPS